MCQPSCDATDSVLPLVQSTSFKQGSATMTAQWFTANARNVASHPRAMGDHPTVPKQSAVLMQLHDLIWVTLSPNAEFSTAVLADWRQRGFQIFDVVLF